MINDFGSVLLIFTLAGFVQGVTGFGAALVAMPLLSLVVDVKTAVPLCILNGLLITLFLSIKLRRHLHWAKIAPLLLGSIPGGVLGVFFLIRTDSTFIEFLLGLLIVFYCFYSLYWQTPTLRLKASWGYVAGFWAGFITGSMSAGGPPVVIYATMTTWSQEQIKATLSGFFFASGLIIAAGHFMSGATSPEVLRYYAGTAPLVLLGVAMGARSFQNVSREIYIRLVLYFLLALGLIMAVHAYPGL